MIRKILAIVSGLVVAIILVWLIEKIGQSVYPPPPGLDFNDPEQLQQFIQGLPAGAFLFVIAAYALATLAGGVVACFIAREKPLLFASIIGAFVLLGTIMNIMMIPHPLWFSITAIGAIVAMTWLASKLGARK